MKIKILIVLSVLISFLSNAYAEDPFSRSFSTPSTVTGDLTLTDDGSDAVHPMMKYDVAKYIDDVTWEKPRAEYYIDDKGVHFDNNWDEVLDKVL